MNTKLKILHLEDLASDAELIGRELKKGGIEFEKLIVDSKAAFEKAIKDFMPDIILSDHSLPSFNSIEALEILKRSGKDIPFILVTATVSEDFAVDMMRNGASDYILKDRLQRLPSAILQAIDKSKMLTAKKIDQEEIRNSRKELRMLTSHLQSVREEERTRIAREIHDELGQQLTGIKMDLSLLLKDVTSRQYVAPDKISEIIDSVDETIKSVRKISSELRPGVLDDLGLIAALDWQSSEFENRFNIPCLFIPKLNEPSLDNSVNTGVFRIYQESLTNIARHANATEVRSSIYMENNNLVLSIADNGRGFSKERSEQNRTLGILGMKERAIMLGGELKIKSEEGTGTKISLRIPLQLIKPTA